MPGHDLLPPFFGLRDRVSRALRPPDQRKNANCRVVSPAGRGFCRAVASYLNTGVEGQQIKAGFVFVVNHSGGKDSQAMYVRLAPLVPARQLIVVHAMLHEVDWPGIPEHIEATTTHPVYYVAAAKSLLDMAEQRGMFPSPRYRHCTSDLKRGPIETLIRRFLHEHPEYQGQVVNCLGFRAEESPARSKLQTLPKSERNSRAGRTWSDWLPIHELTKPEVFAEIEQAGQRPHWAYRAGMSRLSGVFCIMASPQDLRTAAQLNPALYRRYAALEQRLGFTLSMSKQPLPELTGVTVCGARSRT